VTSRDTTMARLATFLAKVANALQVHRNLERPERVAQVGSDRLAQRKQANGLQLDLRLQLINLRIKPDDFLCKTHVASRHGFNRIGKLCFAQPAHLDDAVAQPFKLVMERLDDMFRHGSSL
jgi:hypothetical protein